MGVRVTVVDLTFQPIKKKKKKKKTKTKLRWGDRGESGREGWVGGRGGREWWQGGVGGRGAREGWEGGMRGVGGAYAGKNPHTCLEMGGGDTSLTVLVTPHGCLIMSRKSKEEKEEKRKRAKEERGREQSVRIPPPTKKTLRSSFFSFFEHNVEQAHQLHMVVGPMIHQEFEACFLGTAIRFVRRISFIGGQKFRGGRVRKDLSFGFIP